MKKLKLTQKLLPSLFISLPLLLSSCGGNSESENTDALKENVPDSGVQTSDVASNQMYYINTLTNEKLAEISNEGEQIIVSFNTLNLFGVLKRADKRKYFNQTDNLKYTVKYKSESFKLNDQNENLLWKVKLYDDHIKLSKNNEMTNSYRIGLSESNKIKVKKENSELAALRLKPDDAFLTIPEKYSLRNFGSSLALGVLLIEEIPEEEKVMLCAELLYIGK